MKQAVVVALVAACGTSKVEPPTRACDPPLTAAGEHQGDFCQDSCIGGGGQRFGSASDTCTAHIDLPSGNNIAVTCCAGSGCAAPYSPLFSSVPSGSNGWIAVRGCCVFDLNEDTGAPYHWYYARCDGQ